MFLGEHSGVSTIRKFQSPKAKRPQLGTTRMGQFIPRCHLLTGGGTGLLRDTIYSPLPTRPLDERGLPYIRDEENDDDDGANDDDDDNRVE